MPFQIMKSIIVKFEKSTKTSKPAVCGLFTEMTKRPSLLRAPRLATDGTTYPAVASSSLSLVAQQHQEGQLG